ncbi:MAG: site-specific integrase [Flavobacterium sp.]|nr:MAG: site-specific integrase [Flavobacterium sp.]
MCPKFRTLPYLCLTQHIDMTFNFYLDKPQSDLVPTLQKETAIYLFIRSGQAKIKLNIGRKVFPKYWNEKTQTVKNMTGSMEFNGLLLNIKTELQRAINKMSIEKSRLTLDDIKQIATELVNGKEEIVDTKASFLEAYQLFLDSYSATRTEATVRKFTVLRSHLLDYAKAKRINLDFENINQNFFEGLTSHLVKNGYLRKEKKKEVVKKSTKAIKSKNPKEEKEKQLGLTNNTIAKQIALFKTFMHWAVDRGYTANLTYRKFRAKKEEVDIIYLTKPELMTLYKKDLSDKKALEKVRDVFCFSAFTGQRFSDVAGLKPEHIKENTWHLVSKKTKTRIQVPLNVFALTILKKYITEGKGLPVISNQKTNKHLKELGELAEINEPITLTRYIGSKPLIRTEPKHQFIGTHTARRTFVTLSLENGMRPETVMRITGHKDYNIFRKYIKLTDKVASNEMDAIWKE